MKVREMLTDSTTAAVISLTLDDYERTSSTPVGELSDRLARNIVRLREARQLSGAELCRRSGVDPSHLHKIERGLSWPSDDTLTALARALSVDPAVLLADQIPEKAEVVLDVETARELFEKLGIQLNRAKRAKKDTPSKE